MTVTVVPVRCTNCGADDATPVGEGTDHEYRTVPGAFRMVRCRCGLVYMNPRPDAASVGEIYPPTYYAYELSKKRATGSGGDSALARFMRKRSVARLAPYVERIRASRAGVPRILDVGCGDGARLTEWREAFGGDVHTAGIEMSADAAEIARAAGHDVTTSRIEDAHLPPASFDLVFSIHVIEHVIDPVSFLSSIRDAVRPTGMVILDTPNVDTLDFRLFSRGSWGAYHFPRHFTLYDPRTLTALAEKAGFTVDAISFEPSAVFWVWTMHALLERRAPGIADVLFPPVDIFTRGSPWNVALLSAFTGVDKALIAATGKCAQMRAVLRPR